MNRYTSYQLKLDIMKKALLLISLTILCMGCNMNPNKEDRIQKLETEMQRTIDRVKELENRVHTLEAINEQLEK